MGLLNLIRSKPQPNSVEIRICLSPQSDIKEIVSYLINSDLLGFQPSTMYILGEDQYDKREALKQLEQVTTQGIVFDTDTENFIACQPGGLNAPVTLNWRFYQENYDEKFTQLLIDKIEFTVLNVYDYWDVFWQSCTLKSHYDVFGRKKMFLPMIKDEYDEWVIDTRKNYGKEILLQEIWLLASGKMWFGKRFFEKIISKEKLLGFENAKEIRPDIVYIELFSNIFESKKFRKKQKAFLDYIGIEEIKKKLAR